MPLASACEQLVHVRGVATPPLARMMMPFELVMFCGAFETSLCMTIKPCVSPQARVASVQEDAPGDGAGLILIPDCACVRVEHGRDEDVVGRTGD